jgi:ATP-dependent DNA helicase RecQ
MTDCLSVAVQELFGLPYLFPYQRLVISNILEAAEAAGIAVNWPEGCVEPGWETAAVSQKYGKSGEKSEKNEEKTGEEENSAYETRQDGESYGRQIVILPTGAGKSLCFQFPAMLLGGPTLVLYPILSLMADQQRRLEQQGLSPVLLRGGQSEEERRTLWDKIKSGASRFIIANPEVLLTDRMKEKLQTLNIAHVVIDEAHCVSEWGESFRPAYLQIGEIITACGNPLVTAFTATASAPVLEKIEKYVFGETHGPEIRRIIGNPDRSNIRYAAKGCVLRNLAVRDILLTSELPAIVFCSSRPGTEKLASWLSVEFNQIRPDPLPEPRFYHAGLSREEKDEIEKWFFNNKRGVLVATCAYGMGVDKADIRTVIHRDCPPSVEAYLQESGRAGRDGHASRAILLWGPEDEKRLSLAKNDAEKRRLTELLSYAGNAVDCRRSALLGLLNYEGSADSPEHNCCDVCDNEAAGYLREEAAVMEFFRKNKRSYSIEEAARIMSQAQNIRWSSDEAKHAIREFIRMKKLKVSKNPFWKNRISVPQDQVHH